MSITPGNLAAISEADVRDTLRQWVLSQSFIPDTTLDNLVIVGITSSYCHHLLLHTQYVRQATQTTRVQSAIGTVAEANSWIASVVHRRVLTNEQRTFLTNRTQHTENCPTSEACGSCSGSGTRSCAGCGGSGKVNAPYRPAYVDQTCGTCGGAREVTCSSCGGSNSDECSNCGGSGRMSCSGCGGSGRVQVSTGSYNPMQSCSQCGGSGRLRCNDCYGSGSQVCSTCNGQGVVSYTLYHELVVESYTRTTQSTENPTSLSLKQIQSGSPVTARYNLDHESDLAAVFETTIRTSALALLQEALANSTDQRCFGALEVNTYPVHHIIVALGVDKRPDKLWLIGTDRVVHWPTAPTDWRKLGRSCLITGLVLATIVLGIWFAFFRAQGDTSLHTVTPSPQATFAPTARPTALLPTIAPAKEPTAVQAEQIRFVLSDRLNVRNTPNPNLQDNIIASLYRDDRVRLTGNQTDVDGSPWVEVLLDNGQVGWVNMRYLRE